MGKTLPHDTFKAQLIAEFQRLTVKLGRIPTRREFREMAAPIGRTFERAFLSWKDFVAEAEACLPAAPARPADAPLDLALAKDEVRALRAQLQARSKEELSEKMVRREIFKLAEASPEPPAWLLAHKKGKSAPGVPTLFSSDWHWGEVVDGRQVGDVNRYDLEVAQQRARTMIETAIDLLTRHMANPDYPGIVFALGGDMVSGDIHEELMATNQAEMMPIFVDLFGVLIWCIDRLSDAFGHVFVPCVSGNHGRMTHKIRAKGRNFTNFDWLLYTLLEKHYIAKKDKRVQFFIPDGPDALFRIYGHRYLLTHGDQFRGGDGMVGALGPLVRGDHKKRGRNAQVNMAYDTMLCGHWHQLIQLKRLIVNGSLKGYDEYAYSNNFGFERPQQALWITHPDHGITFSMPVHAEHHQARETTPWVSFQQASA